MLFVNSPVATGNANTLVAGSVIGGPSLFLGNSYRKVGQLSAQVSFTANTSGITVAGSWQVSPDGTNWTTLVTSNNAAAITFATGTVAIKTACFDAPGGLYGSRYARFVLTTGVQTGGTADVYSIGYNFRQLTGAEGAQAP